MQGFEPVVDLSRCFEERRGKNDGGARGNGVVPSPKMSLRDSLVLKRSF